MKLKKLTINNITSFKHAVVDFECEALNQNLFLICGDTGSGKTTILDCICLALYDETPRSKNAKAEKIYDNGYATSNKDGYTTINDTRRWVRESSNEAEIELIFEGNNGVIYTATWSVSRKTRGDNKGQLNPVSRQLQCNTDVWTKVGDINKEIEQAIGLNFEQFCQTTILAQGDFTKFLKSSESERSAILEKLTGTGIYTLLGKKIAEKAKEKRDMLDNAKEKTAHLTLLSNEAIAQINEGINNLKRQAEAAQAAYKQNCTIKELLHNKITLNNKQKQNRQNLSAAGSTYEIRLNELQGAKDQLLRNKLQSDETGKALKPLQKAKNSLENSASLLSGIEEIIKKKELAEKCDLNIHEHTRKLPQLQQNVSLATQAYKEAENVNTYKQKKINALKEQLEQLHETDTRKAIDDIKGTNNQANNIILAYNTMQKRIEELLQDKAALKKLCTELQQCKNNIPYRQADYDTLHTLHEKAEQAYEKAQQSCLDIIKEIRATLHEQDTCPLCGSIITSPLSNARFQSALKPLEEDKKQAKNLAQKALNLLSEAKAKADALTQQYHNDDKKVQQKQQDIAKETARILAQCAHIHINCNIEDVPSRIEELLSTNKDSENLLSQTIKQIDALRQSIDLLQKEKNDCETQVNHAAKAKQVADTNWQQTQSYLSEQKSLKNSYVQEIADKHAQLQPYIDAPYADLWPHKLQELHNCLKADSLQYKAYNEKLIQLNASITNLENDIKEVTGNNETILKEAPKWQDKTACESTYNIDFRKQWSDFVVCFTGLKQSHDDTQKEIEANAQAIAAHIAINEDTDIVDLINNYEQQNNTLQNHINECNQAIGQNVQILKNNEADKQKSSELQQQIAILEADYIQWDKLCRIYGDAQGKNFRNIAQSFVLQHLLHNANIQLRQLMPRFELMCEPGKLTILLRDNYIGGHTITTTNLSGGESFLVSLALALALSSLHQGVLSVDTLFIDEGFGSLDSDYLETVINTLNNLHENSGKRVGIISHMKELEEKIPTKIKVSRVDNATSKLEIIS